MDVRIRRFAPLLVVCCCCCCCCPGWSNDGDGRVRIDHEIESVWAEQEFGGCGGCAEGGRERGVHRDGGGEVGHSDGEGEDLRHNVARSGHCATRAARGALERTPISGWVLPDATASSPKRKGLCAARREPCEGVSPERTWRHAQACAQASAAGAPRPRAPPSAKHA